MTKDDLRSLIPACRKCGPAVLPAPRFGTGQHVRPRLMLVGQNPPADPDRCLHGGWMLHYPAARACVTNNRHEQLMLDLVVHLGLDPFSDVYVTQAIKCPTVGNATPKPEVRRACLSWLREEIALVQPQTILAFGVWAQVALVNLHTPQFRGETDERPLHPGFMVWRPNVRDGVAPDLYEVRLWRNVVEAPHPSVVDRFVLRDSWLRCIRDGFVSAQGRTHTLELGRPVCSG